MFVVLLLNNLAAQLVLRVVPLDRVGAPPASVVNLTLLAITAVGLVLSLWKRGDEKLDEHVNQSCASLRGTHKSNKENIK
jgi:hypothetical protein